MKTSHKIIIGLLLLFILSVTFFFARRAYNAWETLTKPLTFSMTLPNGSDTTSVPLENIITLFPIGESNVYFEVKDKNGILKIDSKEFVSLIKNQEKTIGKNKFTVALKSTENAKYKDMVDLLDKLSFLNIKRFSILGITEEENNRIKSFLKN